MLQNTNCDKISLMLRNNYQAIKYISQDWKLYVCEYPVLECVKDRNGFPLLKFIDDFQKYFIDFNDG